MVKKIILILFLLASIIYCQKWNNKYLFNEVDGYIQLSKETMRVLVDKMHYPIKDKSLYSYDYYFQKYPFDTLLVTPFIRIQINERGRLTQSELLGYEKSYHKYDSKTNYLWQEKGAQLNVIIPTNLGTINVYCYSTKNNYAKDKESFIKFINSIMLFPEVKYDASIIRDIPFNNDEGKYLLSLISISIVLIILFRKQIKKVVT